MSLVTTMLFLGTMQYGMHILEYIIVFFVGIMSIAIFVEMSFVQPDTSELMKGWIYGFVDVTTDDLFTIAGILGTLLRVLIIIIIAQQKKSNNCLSIHSSHLTATNPRMRVFSSFFSLLHRSGRYAS